MGFQYFENAVVSSALSWVPKQKTQPRAEGLEPDDLQGPSSPNFLGLKGVIQVLFRCYSGPVFTMAHLLQCHLLSVKGK